MRRRDVGRGRRLRPVERVHRAREAESRFGAPAYGDRPRLIRTPVRERASFRGVP